MAKRTNSFVPKYVPENFPWFERDGHGTTRPNVTWYDQAKCADFLRNMDRHLSETKIVDFDIIHRQYCGEVVPSEILKHYQTVNEKTVSTYPSNAQTEIRSSAFRTDKKDMFSENETIKKHFKKIDNKKSKVLLRQSSF